MKELLEAKRVLYTLLLRKSSTELTDVEADLMSKLALDEQIQSLFDKN